MGCCASKKRKNKDKKNKKNEVTNKRKSGTRRQSKRKRSRVSQTRHKRTSDIKRRTSRSSCALSGPPSSQITSPTQATSTVKSGTQSSEHKQSTVQLLSTPAHEQQLREKTKRSATVKQIYEDMVAGARNDTNDDGTNHASADMLATSVLVVDDQSERDRLREESSKAGHKTPHPPVTVIGLPARDQTTTPNDTQTVTLPVPNSPSRTNLRNKPKTMVNMTKSRTRIKTVSQMIEGEKKKSPSEKDSVQKKLKEMSKMVRDKKGSNTRTVEKRVSALHRPKAEQESSSNTAHSERARQMIKDKAKVVHGLQPTRKESLRVQVHEIVRQRMSRRALNKRKSRTSATRSSNDAITASQVVSSSESPQVNKSSETKRAKKKKSKSRPSTPQRTVIGSVSESPDDANLSITKLKVGELSQQKELDRPEFKVPSGPVQDDCTNQDEQPKDNNTGN